MIILNIKRNLALIMAFIISISLVGCGSKKTATTSKETKGPPIRIMETSGNVRIALMILAKELGYYEEEGVDVEFVNLQSAPEAINAIQVGKLDVVPVSIVPPLNFISQGSDLVIYGGTAAEGHEIIAKPERAEEFKDFKNFKGKNVGVIRLDTADIVTRAKIREAGVDTFTEINYIELDSWPSVIEAVKKGAVDVGFTSSEFARRAEAQGLKSVKKVASYQPNYVCCRQTAGGASIREYRNDYVALQRANIRAYKFYKTQKEKTIEILMKHSGQSYEFVNTNVYEDAPPLSPDPSKNRIVDFYGYLKEEGIINSDVDVSKNIDITIYQDALEQIIKKYPNDAEYMGLKQVFAQNNL